MFDPFRWFWLSDDGQVYDSEQQRKTVASDSRYQVWSTAGGYPTPWPRDTNGAQTDAALQDVLDPYGLLVSPTIDTLKARLKTSVDAAAEVERLKYITAGAGQAMEYAQAADEATAYLAALAKNAGYKPVKNTFPMLEASLGVDGNTLAQVAQTVKTMNDAWQAVGSAIRAVRLKAKADIDAATDEAQARAVVEHLNWGIQRQ